MKNHKSIKLWGTNTSTVLSITLVLFVLGLLMLLGLHSYQYTNSIEEGVLYNVVLSPDTDEASAMRLKAQLENKADYPYIKDVHFISKEEAAESFSRELGDDFVSFIGHNPLFPSLEVSLKSNILGANNGNTVRQFVTRLKGNAIVDDVVYQENMVTELDDTLRKLAWFMIGIVALLLFVSIMLINATIRIAIYEKRFTIKTMQLVGAKRGFIIGPYLRRSVLFGFLGGLMAIALVILLVYIVNSQMNTGIDFAGNMDYYIVLGLLILILGIVISFVSTYFSLLRYIRMSDSKLY
ncbi:MAG: permease-like cell division protein FtsX [Bacteroidales bacterium]|nr:permease-like cell division protein FtsX [Bacteroidales bacterium]